MSTNPKDEPGILISDVEIFRSGIWNGDRYTEKDLDDMIEAFSGVGYRPPVKLGHDAKDSDPAYGFIENLRRVGDTLVADFANVPHELAEMIRNKRFGSVSSEIFFNLARNGRKFRRALKAVAVIGADVPGVADLKPLYEATFGEHTFGKLICADEFKPFSEDPGKSKQRKVKPMTVQEIQKALTEAIANGEADQISDLTGQLVAATSEAAKAEAKAEAEAALTEKGDETKTLTQEIHTLRQEVASFKKEAAKSAEEARQANLTAKVKDVIPAIRPHVRALYDLASRDEGKVAKFTLNEGDKEVELSAQEIVDGLVAHLSKAQKIFTTEQGENIAPEAPAGDPGADVEKAVAAYRQKAKEEGREVSYSQAQEAVFAADPDLKARYAAGVN